MNSSMICCTRLKWMKSTGTLSRAFSMHIAIFMVWISMDMPTCTPMSMNTITFTNLSRRIIYTNLGMKRVIMSIQVMKSLIHMINNPNRKMYPLRARQARLRKNGSGGGTHMGMGFIHTDDRPDSIITAFTL